MANFYRLRNCTAHHSEHVSAHTRKPTIRLKKTPHENNYVNLIMLFYITHIYSWDLNFKSIIRQKWNVKMYYFLKDVTEITV